ncbi:MAG: hypothetical protein K0R90_278 [Oscillospiraceae bacterium]|nr:hypothetical protein [Oscillospiraceae bacterium]
MVLRRFFSALLVFSLLFGLTACGSNNQALNNSSNSNTAVSSNLLSLNSSQSEEESAVASFNEYPSSSSSVSFEKVDKIKDIVSYLKPSSSTSSVTQSTSSAKSSSTGVLPSSTSYVPLNYQETKAIWISYLEYGTILKSKSQQAFQASVAKMFDNVISLGLNTVIVQVRPFSDAIYASDYYPWSAYASGTVGKAPSFDPLKIMIEQAHKRKISLHAWVNPLRGMTEAETKKVANNFSIKKWHDTRASHDKLVYKGDRWFLNPAHPEVRTLIANGVQEIVKKYDVDGIHIDDYFYPTTAKSFDEKSYKLYGAGKTLSDFRLNNCNQMLKQMYSAIKKVNPQVEFGASPQGNVNNNYTSQFADVKRWCSEKGYIDYIAPQIYFGFENQSQPFDKTLKTWNDMIKLSSVKMIVGLACHKIDTQDKWAGTGSNEWKNQDDIIKKQIVLTKKQTNYDGFILFDYKSLFDLKTGEYKNNARVKKEINNFKVEIKNDVK